VALSDVAGSIEAYTGRVAPPDVQIHADAISRGAECWRCPLLGCKRGPVPPTLPPGPIDILVVAEAPGINEVREGKVLIGASGRELRKSLQQAHAPMERVGLTNASACMPDGGDMKKYLQQCKKKGLPSPIDCCSGRLRQEIARASFVILMGGASVTAAGINQTVMKVRGTPLQIPNGPRALATPHAAFVLRDEGARYRPVFHADVTKAVRLAYGGNTWKDPRYFVPKSAVEVANFLAVQRPRVAVDVETDGIDRWVCNLRRVGVGDDKEVMIFSPLSVKGHALLHPDEAQAQARVIGDYFMRAPRIDTHNGIAFDSIILHRFGMTIPDAVHYDGMVAHQVGVTSELPHGLDFCGSMYTDAPHWKDDVKHSNVPDDAILDRYLSYDIAVTHVSTAYTEQNLINTSQQHIYTLDAELFRIGRAMSTLGIYIDPVKRLAFAEEYQQKSDRLLAEFIEVAGRPVNPASYPQMRKLLYEDLGLSPLEMHMTDSDEPSTDENTLLDLLSLGVDERAERVIHALIGYREAEKILGTNTGHAKDGRIEGGPPVHWDGRLRTTWRPGKTAGRWGSNSPVNLQNIPKKLRAMFIPAPGNVFVAADMSAVELRMIALLAGDEPLIAAFAAFDAKTGPDVHVANACGVFRCTPEQVTDEVRNFIKRFVYALNYGAEPPKIYQTLSLMRDDNLQPLFPGITLQMVERVYAIWWQQHPAIVEWKKKCIYGWRARGYMETEYHKRKRFFIGGESPTEMANFPIQGAAADLQNGAIQGLVRAYPFDFERHRGLVVNGHDQLVVECAAGEAEDVKRIVETVMQKKIGKMLFPAQAKAAESWKAVS
jgi:uracil-DNA glycosylase family 4